MITLLSPSKTQVKSIVENDFLKTNLVDIDKANILIDLVKGLSIADLSLLLKIKEPLARNLKNAIENKGKNSVNVIQSIFLFQGDAFQKLDAATFTRDDLLFSQDHLIILSALYGFLRPLDLVGIYRLDMKDPLGIPGFKNLYDYWKKSVNQYINMALSKQKNPILLNLASSEYASLIDQENLFGEMVNVEFKVQKNNVIKTVGIYAKRGRGLMARYILKNRIDSPKKIVDFNLEGFQFSNQLSSSVNYVFILEQ